MRTISHAMTNRGLMKTRIVVKIAMAMAVCLAALASYGSHASGQVVISEIMYNPDSYEGNSNENKPNLTEWIELYNAGEEPIDLTGYLLSDEDGQTEAMPPATMLEPGEAMVIVPSGVSEAAFHEAWGSGEDGPTQPGEEMGEVQEDDTPHEAMKKYRVLALGGWTDGIRNLANSPSPKNEILTLIDKAGRVVFTVNYDDQGDWPSDSPDGSSIYLLPQHVRVRDSANQGEQWGRSVMGQHGGRGNVKTSVYTGMDFGSPGVVVVGAAGTE